MGDENINNSKEQVMALLLMRYNLVPEKSIDLIEKWFAEYPNKSWLKLKQLLQKGQVIVKDNALYDIFSISEQEIKSLVAQMRGLDGLEIKDRWYNFKRYPQCFIGSDAVKWLMKNQKITREGAIALGQMLIKRGIIAHVVNEHQFEDSYLFYRFKVDEVRARRKQEYL